MQKSKPHNLASDHRRSTKNFLALIVLRNGKVTVGDCLIPQIDKAYESGKMPQLLPGW